MNARELTLTFERDVWRASGEGVDVAHRELRGLEALIEMRLAREGPVDVRLNYDLASIPRWLHQYHGHYCNYTLRLPKRCGGE